MSSPLQRIRIAISWLMSFLLRDWLPEQYPIEVRRQTGVLPASAWCARVLNWPGPAGLGATEAEARAALLVNLSEISATRRQNGQAMPRPGTKGPIEFATSCRVDANPALLDDFIANVLGYGPHDPVFISDESSISDFGDEEEVERIRRRIQSHYGIAIQEPEPVLIAQILERVRIPSVA